MKRNKATHSLRMHDEITGNQTEQQINNSFFGFSSYAAITLIRSI